MDTRRLSTEEYNALQHITSATKTDCWFTLETDENGNDYIFDSEQNEYVTWQEGLGMLNDAICWMKKDDYELIGIDEEEIKTFYGLLDKVVCSNPIGTAYNLLVDALNNENATIDDWEIAIEDAIGFLNQKQNEKFFRRLKMKAETMRFETNCTNDIALITATESIHNTDNGFNFEVIARLWYTVDKTTIMTEYQVSTLTLKKMLEDESFEDCIVAYKVADADDTDCRNEIDSKFVCRIDNLTDLVTEMMRFTRECF